MCLSVHRPEFVSTFKRCGYLVDQETKFYEKIEEVVRFVKSQVFVCVPERWNAISINEWHLKNLSHRNCCIYKMTKNILGSEKNTSVGIWGIKD
jgi:hypothetical protein